jgi:AraC-like DNA-binding protein
VHRDADRGLLDAGTDLSRAEHRYRLRRTPGRGQPPGSSSGHRAWDAARSGATARRLEPPRPRGKGSDRATSRRRARVGLRTIRTIAVRTRSPLRRPDHREATAQTLAELYVKAGTIVERHYRRPLTLTLVARTLATSPRQVERAYDEIGLTTFTAHLRAVRLRNAAELLTHQPLTVTDVARLVGYRQPSHFVKAFRRRYATTPGAFRDRAQALDHSRTHVAGPKGLRASHRH